MYSLKLIYLKLIRSFLPGAGILHIEWGSVIAQLEFYHCWEPAWGTPPVAKVMRKEARHTQRRDRASGVPLEILEHLPPNQSLPTFCFVLSSTPLTLWGAVPHHLWKRVNLQLQLIKFLGVTRVFQPTNSFGSPLACLNRFFWPHVIVQSLPTVRGMRCSKLSKNCIGEGIFTCWANVAAKFP